MEYATDDPNVISGKRMNGANIWPAAVPGFDVAARAYMAQMERLGKRLLPVWAVALGLEPNHFGPSFEHAHSYVRTIRYPGKAQLDVEELGIRPHVDTSFVTLLPRENEPRPPGYGRRWGMVLARLSSRRNYCEFWHVSRAALERSGARHTPPGHPAGIRYTLFVAVVHVSAVRGGGGVPADLLRSGQSAALPA